MNGSIPLPDLRFEQSFMRSLQGYADDTLKKPFVKLLKLQLSKRQDYPDDLLDEIEAPPLSPITPSVVLYAIIKDQIIMPLVQGFLWAGILLSWRPIRVSLIGYGLRSGQYLYNMIGIPSFKPYK